MAVRIEAQDGRYVQFDADGYQFPSARGDEWDDEWLFITLDAFDGEKRWTRREPALSTVEIASLAEWLKNLGEGAPTESLWENLEPCLAIRAESVGAGDIMVHVLLDHEFHPSLFDGAADLTFELSRPGILVLAGQAADILMRFPIRTVRT